MDAFAAELEACLAELEPSADGDATMIQPARAARRRAAAPASSRTLAARRRAARAARARGDRDRRSSPIRGLGRATAPRPAAPHSKRVPLTGAASLRPVRRRQGGARRGGRNATDGDPDDVLDDRALRRRTSFDKPGVGLVLDAGARRPRAARHRDRHAGLHGADQGGEHGRGHAGASRLADRRRTTTFDLTQNGPKQYYVLWITQLPSDDHVRTSTKCAPTSPSTQASRGARGARARARSAARAAPRTGSPTPRRASRRRSSP